MRYIFYAALLGLSFYGGYSIDKERARIAMEHLKMEQRK